MSQKLVYVDKVGVELEGGWNRLFVPKTHIIYDMSVGNAPWGPPPPNVTNAPCGCGDGCKTQTCHWGEIPSPPLPLPEVLKWTADHYPDGINNSCGLHVHVSLKSDILYGALMSKRFFDHFMEEVGRWAKDVARLPKDHIFWERYSKKYDPHAPDAKTTVARFCNKGFMPLKQINLTTKEDERRSPLNYCHKMHGTLECRLFPGFENPKLALSAIEFYVTCVDEWLVERFRTATHKRVTIRI